jgi:flagellin
MGIRINQNVMAMNAYRNLTTTEGQLSRSLERLSSGYRINRAADDAAGLVISEGLRSQVMGLKMATRNAQDGVSVVQTAEGALTETHAILQRMRELAVQSASTGSSDQPSRDAAQVEVVQLKAELDRISSTTKFGEQNLLDGSYGVTNGVVTGATTDGDSDGLLSGVAPTDLDIDVAATGDGNKFNINVNGAGAVEVTLDVVDYSGMAVNDTTAAAIAKNINDNLVAALAGAGQAYDEVVAKVEVDGEGTGYIFSFEATRGADFVLQTATTAADDILAEFDIASGSTGNSTGSGGVFQVGSGTSVNDRINITIGNMASGASGLVLQAVDVSDSALSTANITSIDSAITAVSTLRGNLGAYQNRFERTISNLSVTTENLSASESRIRDTDMASEMMSFTRAQILQQAGTAMLAQANAVPQSVLQLLQ